ncbi:hypothetical protein TNCV_1719821 [Trichonephila clavipes]|nr:hypothetical protein TNCV_1719821 [Trichonephila clavipes]
MWDALGRQVAGQNYPPTNKNTLIRAITEEWDKLPQQLLDNVVQMWQLYFILRGLMSRLNVGYIKQFVIRPLPMVSAVYNNNFVEILRVFMWVERDRIKKPHYKKE